MPRPTRARPVRRLHRDLLATTALALGLGLVPGDHAQAQAYNAGPGSSAGGANATAVGSNANAGGDRSFAGGYNAASGGADSTAVGSGASGSGDRSFAGGYNANASGPDAVAIGSGTAAAAATQPQRVIDYRTTPNGIYTLPNESAGTTGVTPSSTAIGRNSTVGGGGGVSIGYNNRAGVTPGSGSAFSSTAIGTNNNASGGYAVGIGVANTASGVSAIGIGTATQAIGNYSAALGRQSYAIGDYSFAAGFRATAYGNTVVTSPASGAIAIGTDAYAGQNNRGTTLAIGNRSVATTPTDTGDSMALGTDTSATGQDSLAIGAQTTASGMNTIAIGNNGTVSGSNESVVVGIGASASSAATGAAVLGNGASATADNATVLGRNASVTQSGGVALGFGSMALRGALNGATEAFSNTAVNSTLGAVSVGSAGSERQITNVAGGTADTDAVNLRQLRAVGSSVSGVASSLGGSFTEAAGYTAPTYSYGGQSYGKVTDTVAAIDTFALRYDRDGSGNRLASIDLSRGGTVGGGSGVALTGLAPGSLTATSQDAVNGGQLYTTNQSVAALQNGTAGLVQQSGASNPITVGRSTGGTVVDLTGGQGTRRLIGLSAGTGASDAATLGQLRGSSGALGGGAGYDPTTGAFTAPSYTVGGATYRDVGSALTATNTLAVQYVPDASGNPTGAVNLARNSGTPVALRGVAAGDISSTASTDAVNGGQLYTTNQSVAALQNGTAGLVQQANGTAPITVGSGTAGTLVNFTNNAGAARVLTGVAAGSVASGSTDAVNGGQLYDLGQQVGSNYQAIANGTVGLVQQDPTSRAITVGSATDGRLVDLTGTQGARRLTGLASGTGDGDAATVGQLRAGGQMLAGGLGGGATFDPATNTYTAPSYTIGGRSYGDVGSALAATSALSVQYVPDGNGQPTDVVDLARGGTTPVALRGVRAGAVAANSTDAVNGGQLYAVTQSVTDLQNGAAGLVRQDPTTRAITVGGSTDGTSVSFANQAGTARTLGGVAAGQIAAGSTQGVNGGQIYASNAAIAAALGGGATVAADGTLTAPRYVVQGSTFNNVGGALGSLDAAVTNISTTGTKYLAVRSTGAAAQAQAADSVAIGPAATTTADGGVALGARAVASRAGLNGAREAFSGISVASTQGAVSVGDAGAERQVTNVAGGTMDTDAVNLRQLRAASGTVAGALGGGAGFADDGSFTAPSYTIAGKQYASVGAALGAVDAYGVKYDVDPTTGGRGQALTLAGGDPNQPVLIRNVAAGVKPTDAANVGQVAQARADAIAYTDAAVAPLQNQMSAFGGQLADLNRQIGEVRGEARRGAAIGLAAAALRFDDRPGKISVAAGGGVWRGETAASFGVGYTLPDGSGRVNATGVAAGGSFGVGAGASFTLN